MLFKFDHNNLYIEHVLELQWVKSRKTPYRMA